jgi:peptidoglycan/xylan/chitin deacetylase (PgdA/CDA1 family)
LGDKAHSRVWFARTAAIRADYRDTWARLQESGGVNHSGATVYSGRSDEKCVALTFDDGPKPGVTEPLLEVLTAAHIPATFFVIGRHIQEYPELAKAISAAGMEIDNHSYTHRSLTALSTKEAEQEMLQTQAAVLAITGSMPRYIRPPGGNWNNQVADIARRWGLTPCMWSVDVFDAEIIGSQKVAETVLSQTRPGSIVLMHNGKVSTLQALPNILRVLRSRGYRFVTVDELARRSVGAKMERGRVQAESRKTHAE